MDGHYAAAHAGGVGMTPFVNKVDQIPDDFHIILVLSLKK